MSKVEASVRIISPLLDVYIDTGDVDRVTAQLLSNSRLPGPRANLELSVAFADTVGEHARQDPGTGRRLWHLCVGFANLSPDFAPAGDPGEFLAFCGIQGIGAIGAGLPEYFGRALDHLRDASEDQRWRAREAAAIAVQRLLESRPDETLAALEGWIEQGTWLEMRGAAAGLAEPALLADAKTAQSALKLHRKILVRVLTAGERTTDEFRTLRQALGYTLSVVISALPGDGFTYLRQLAVLDDPDIRWIVRENLKKNRLAKKYPGEVEAVRTVLA
ncbi:MAG: hypothetical protein PHV57_04820 [Methanomicrobiaceae archaeon]|nr:hypothetical protein [Methanomicrobiaceae archaeon]